MLLKRTWNFSGLFKEGSCLTYVLRYSTIQQKSWGNLKWDLAVDSYLDWIFQCRHLGQILSDLVRYLFLSQICENLDNFVYAKMFIVLASFSECFHWGSEPYAHLEGSEPREIHMFFVLFINS